MAVMVGTRTSDFTDCFFAGTSQKDEIELPNMKLY
jgi:hypothetical protein